MVEEVFAEVSAIVAAVGAVDAAEAVAGAAVPGAASPRTRKYVSNSNVFKCITRSNEVILKTTRILLTEFSVSC